MRNSFKGFFPTNLPKFQVIKFNTNGHNSAIRLNLFSNVSAKRDSVYNAIMLPVFDNKSFYSNYTYKYFNLKWSKFEQKNNYCRYVKTPSAFPNFLTNTNYFMNAFLTRRRKKRVYKRRKIRVSVYFNNRFLRSTKSIFRAYRLRPFYGKKKTFRLRKKLIRPLAKRKTFKVVFSKYWIRRRWYKFSRRHAKNRKFYRFGKPKLKNKKTNKNTFYFKKRTYRFRVFRFFGFKKNLKKILYARRYAYLKTRKFRKFRNVSYKSSLLLSYRTKIFSKRVFKLQFFKRLVKKIIKRKYFFKYLGHKLAYKVRSRIFFNKFGILRFLGFKNHLLKTYFHLVQRFDRKVKNNSNFLSTSSSFFSHLFAYPQKLLSSKNNFYFKFFSAYNLLKNKKLKRFKNYFNLNLKQYYYFFKVFNDFFSIISIFRLNFLPFKFELSKKKFFKKFESRISALQYLQRRKLARNLRFCTYFFLFIRVIQLKRGTKFYRRIIKKLMKFIYRRSKSGRILFFLPFVLNKFIYFGLLSHFNPNIYLRDPSKFNDFYSSKLRKSKFTLHNKI
jgi:hypothetical protein